MLDETTIRHISIHGKMHQIGLCICPCYDALITVGEALKKEMALRAKLAEASPELLAALTIGSAPDVGSERMPFESGPESPK